MTMIDITSKISVDPNKVSAIHTELNEVSRPCINSKNQPDMAERYSVSVQVVVDGQILTDEVDFGDDGDAAAEWLSIIKDDVNRARES